MNVKGYHSRVLSNIVSVLNIYNRPQDISNNSAICITGYDAVKCSNLFPTEQETIYIFPSVQFHSYQIRLTVKKGWIQA